MPLLGPRWLARANRQRAGARQYGGAPGGGGAPNRGIGREADVTPTQSRRGELGQSPYGPGGGIALRTYARFASSSSPIARFVMRRAPSAIIRAPSSARTSKCSR